MNLFKNVIISLLFFSALAISVYGVMVPSNSQVTFVGSMQIAPFPDGLSLFQDYRRLYYRFSPFNDYVIDTQGNRSTFISLQEIQDKQYTNDLDRSQLYQIKETVYSYLTNGNSDVMFTTNTLTASYKATTNDTALKIIRKITYNNPSTISRMGSTLAYLGDDIVFDGSGNVYNFWNDQDLNNFTQAYGVEMTLKNENLQVAIPSKTIYIMNPRATFLIAVHARQNQTLRVNRDAKLIEVEETVEQGTSYSSTLDIQILRNPKEVL